ncbi:MAG: Eco57I restriction-modification methylase domain-containing protein, partial [Candidatus Thorarchaeota archaeon]
MTISGSSSLAWELVREQRKATAQLVADDKELESVASEMTRLAVLNHSLHIWSSASSLKPRKLKGLAFRTPTLSVRQVSIDEIDLITSTKQLIDEAEASYSDERITNLSCDDFLELIAHIHSIGSYHLPDGQTPSVPQRVLGAYYTPREVSDFIADYTLSPLVKRLAKEHGLNALREHLKLIDPACGPGAFLLSSIRICAAMFPELSLHEAARIMKPNLYGVDLDRAALELADVSLSIMCRQQIGNSKTRNLGTTLKAGNSLISLNGWNGLENHEGYFKDPTSRHSFEWRSQFPEIFSGESTGFDALLMNPPYERLKPNFAEFMRERLLSGSRMVHGEDFENYKANLQEDLHYYRNSGEYSLANRHTLDTYRLFIERSLKMVRPGGKIGFIVPSTVLGDLSAEQLRRSLLIENTVKALHDFPEGNKLFENVTQSVSIVVLDRGGTTKNLKVSFGLKTMNEARKSRGYRIRISEIPEIMQKSMVIPRIEREGWRILKHLHSNLDLGSIDWLANKRGEFDLTLHKRFITGKGARLVRGSNIGRYSLRKGRRRPDEFVDLSSFHTVLGSSSRIEDSHLTRLACQQISNRNQRWRLKFALVDPGVVLANSCNYFVLSKDSDQNLLYYLLGVFNSELMNWRFNVSSTNNHVSNRELSELPLPVHAAIDMPQTMQRIIELARNCLSEGRTYDAELEALVFSLYGIDTRN